MADDPNRNVDIEFSPLCQNVTRDGTTVRVSIYRIRDVEQRWTLEVVDRNNASAVWDELFDTEDDAILAFGAALDATGIGGLTESFH